MAPYSSKSSSSRSSRTIKSNYEDYYIPPVVGPQPVLIVTIIGSLAAVVLLALVVILIINCNRHRSGTTIWLQQSSPALVTEVDRSSVHRRRVRGNTNEITPTSENWPFIPPADALRQLERLATATDVHEPVVDEEHDIGGGVRSGRSSSRFQYRIVIDKQSISRLVDAKSLQPPSLDSQCSICLENIFATGSENSLDKSPSFPRPRRREYHRQLQRCGHVFHRNCIDRWLSEFSALCPVCKQLSVDYQRNDGPVLDGNQAVFLRSRLITTSPQTLGAQQIQIEIGSVPRSSQRSLLSNSRVAMQAWSWWRKWLGCPGSGATNNGPSDSGMELPSRINDAD